MDRDALSEALPAFVRLSVISVEGGTAPLFDEELALLPERAAPIRKRDFTAGRSAAREALRSLGVEAGPILRGPGREPMWPTGVVGSITHAGGWAVAAVALQSDCSRLGIDAEHRSRTFDELVDNVAFDVELDWMAGLSLPSQTDAALAVFSAKESVYKAFYPTVGEYFGFESVRLEPLPSGGFECRFVDDIDTDFPPTRRFDVGCLWLGDVVFTSVVLPG